MKLDTFALWVMIVAIGIWGLVYGGALVFAAGSVSPVLAGLALLAAAPFAYLLVRVVRDRLSNAEDDHYERTVDK